MARSGSCCRSKRGSAGTSTLVRPTGAPTAAGPPPTSATAFTTALLVATLLAASGSQTMSRLGLITWFLPAGLASAAAARPPVSWEARDSGFAAALKGATGAGWPGVFDG